MSFYDNSYRNQGNGHSHGYFKFVFRKKPSKSLLSGKITCCWAVSDPIPSPEPVYNAKYSVCAQCLWPYRQMSPLSSDVKITTCPSVYNIVLALHNAHGFDFCREKNNKLRYVIP